MLAGLRRVPPSRLVTAATFVITPARCGRSRTVTKPSRWPLRSGIDGARAAAAVDDRDGRAHDRELRAGGCRRRRTLRAASVPRLVTRMRKRDGLARRAWSRCSTARPRGVMTFLQMSHVGSARPRRRRARRLLGIERLARLVRVGRRRRRRRSASGVGPGGSRRRQRACGVRARVGCRRTASAWASATRSGPAVGVGGRRRRRRRRSAARGSASRSASASGSAGTGGHGVGSGRQTSGGCVCVSPVLPDDRRPRSARR